MAVEFEGRHDHDHSSKKFKILQGRSCLAPIYQPVILLCLLIFITAACFYYNSDDPMSYFAVPKITKSTSISPHIAVCLVGGARRFELTGPSILKHVLNVFPEADLFVHTNLDDNAFKLGLLKSAPRVAEVRIRKPVPIPETDERKRVLWPSNIGIQALLQYFDLVEGCLDMIRSSESNGNFTYDWIVRARADSYWTGPLDSRTFNGTDSYIVPEGSRYNGLNDRLGVGNRSSSQVALSRMSLIRALDAAGYRNLNSECSFHAQLKVYNISAEERKFPFCILTDRSCNYPPRRWDLPVTALSSPGPLNGAYCQPCVPQCKGECLEQVTKAWDGSFSWIEWRNGTIELCDARHPWQDGWEDIFDRIAGEAAANERRRFKEMKAEECVTEMEALRAKSERWNGPDPAEICNFRFKSKN